MNNRVDEFLLSAIGSQRERNGNGTLAVKSCITLPPHDDPDWAGGEQS